MLTLSSDRLNGPDDVAAQFTDMYEKGITDGLPVIPPLEQYVSKMIEYVGLPPDKVIAYIPPEDGPATVEKIAICAVMAGCVPEYFPVVLAAIRAVSAPHFNLLAIQGTTNPVAPVLVINGPIRKQIGINCGRGCMGTGFRANATIGRALKLVMINIGRCSPGDVSKSTHGMPGRFTFCFGEAEEQSPWAPFHVDRGFQPEQSTVTAIGGQGTQSVYATFRTAEGIAHMVANSMSVYGNNGYLRESGNPLVVITPGHAQIFDSEGWSKQRLKEELFQRTIMPLNRVTEEKQLSNPIYQDRPRNENIRLCTGPEKIAIIVAGGPEAYHACYIPSFCVTEMSTAVVETSFQ